MGQLILHKDGAYQIYTTVADGACFERALTLDELTEYIRQELGEAGLRELPQRLERAHKTGCSSMHGMTLAECLVANRAGENESELSFDEFVTRYLTLTPNAKVSGAGTASAGLPGSTAQTPSSGD